MLIDSCWEGPLPAPHNRDFPLDADFTIPKPIFNGVPVNCRAIYNNYITQLPFFFYSRYASDKVPPFFENAFLGQGFYGNAIVGVAVYNSTSYPPKYHNTGTGLIGAGLTL